MYNKKHFLIIGASSKTGTALIEFLSSKHINYSLSDTKPNFFESIKTSIKGSQPTYIYDSPTQDFSQLKDINHIIIAPGVPRQTPLLQEAKKNNIPIDSEIAFAHQYLKENDNLPTMIGVTGSNGKSTTCALTYEVLKNNYKEGQVFLLGNFGTPFITEASNFSKKDLVVLELSSYQLEDGEKYHLDIATIVNLTENHLDRYNNSFEEYKNAKMKIFASQNSEDIAILNMSSPEYKDLLKLNKAKTVLISSSYNPEATFSIKEKDIYHYNKLFIKNEELFLNQEHMLLNMLTVSAVAYQLDIDLELAKKTLISFKGLEHRTEFIREVNQITIINDSKATTPHSIIPNLKGAFKNIILILGGRNKNIDFSVLNEHLEHVNFIMFYGESGLEIKEQVAFKNTDYLYSFKEAVEKAYQVAKDNSPSVLLLSTGCTSFDQFKSFEERGQFFKKLAYDFR